MLPHKLALVGALFNYSYITFYYWRNYKPRLDSTVNTDKNSTFSVLSVENAHFRAKPTDKSFIFSDFIRWELPYES